MRPVVVHGHFYQPPRENPWTGKVDREPSAAPFPNWNARILAECYAANRDVALPGPDGRTATVSNYRRLSYDFGPTLLDWLGEEAPDLIDHLREVDAESTRRLGRGNAVAQAYNHAILPLLSRRDKRTQVRWGLAHFRRTFGREAEGMWLPETAADAETLDVLAEEGVGFTILSPGQLRDRRSSPDASWSPARAASDVGRAYRHRTTGGREIALFFYDGMVAGDVAFGSLTGDGAELAGRLLRAAGERTDDGPLTAVATDGETFGHHHKGGEKALGSAFRRLECEPGIDVTNFAAFLRAYPAVWEARIVDPGSWSCAHGVERWRGPCGCSTEGTPPEGLAWRAPLFEGVHLLGDGLDTVFEREGEKLFRDPWGARDGFIDVLLDPAEETRRRFLDAHALPGAPPATWIPPAGTNPGGPGWTLLEMERYVQLSFTSCGWFFDDPSGLETRQILRYATRALEMARPWGVDGLAARFREVLASMRSRRHPELDGAALLERAVNGGENA